MFDGISHLVLCAADTRPLLELYRDHLGFQDQGRVDIATAGPYHQLWRLPDGPIEVTTLGKPGATGGELRLVQVRALSPPAGPRTMHDPGPFALDVYVRDLPALHQRLREAGYRFRSETVSYPLFGTDFSVDEILLEAPLGFVHALVEYRPGQHRCLLGQEDDASVSEFVAAITVVDDVDEALTTLRDVLGGQVYFDEVFQGPAVEALLALPAGSAFRTVLLRGPGRRNARLEIMATVPGAPPALPRAHPHLLLSIQLDDLDLALARLGAAHEVEGPHTLDDGPHAGRRVATVWTTWGAVLELVGPR